MHNTCILTCISVSIITFFFFCFFFFFFFLIPSPFNQVPFTFISFHTTTTITPSVSSSTSSTMSSSHKLCLSSLRKCVTKSLHHLKALMSKIKQSKRRNPKKRLLTSGFDWITSSFAAMEVSNQLRQVFNLIDANGDGKISSLELGEVLLCLGHEKSTAAKQAEGMVREADCNGDGFIDLDEFMDVVGSNKSADEDLREAFLVFDLDKNGFISAKELKQVLISLGHYKCTLHECSSMIRGVDKDGDGLVNFEEFRSMMTAG